MPVAAFRRRGEDLADLEIDQRAAVVADGWTVDPRQEGPLRLDLAIHNLEDRCLGKKYRPLIAATSEEHFLDHIDGVWQGDCRTGRQVGPAPSLYQGRASSADRQKHTQRPWGD